MINMVKQILTVLPLEFVGLKFADYTIWRHVVRKIIKLRNPDWHLCLPTWNDTTLDSYQVIQLELKPD